MPECFEVSGRDTFCVAKTTDRSSFASSVTTMDKMVKNMINLLGLNIIQSIQLVTVNPARMQMLDDEIGILSPGMKADLTVFNKQIDVQLTMVDGKIVFQNTKQNR